MENLAVGCILERPFDCVLENAKAKAARPAHAHWPDARRRVPPGRPYLRQSTGGFRSKFARYLPKDARPAGRAVQIARISALLRPKDQGKRRPMGGRRVSRNVELAGFSRIRRPVDSRRIRGAQSVRG